MDTVTKTIELVMLVDDNDTDNFISKRIIEITKFARRVEVKSSGKSALDYLKENQNIPDILAKRGMRLDIGGGAVIDILFPDQDVSSWTSNDGSIVARLQYGDESIMLTGDATMKTEKIILGENPSSALHSTVLKVGHHGSRTSTSNEFVKAVSPTYALISDGKDNKYGHPHPETLDTLAQFGAKIFRTDLLGTIIIKCAKMGVCEIN